MRVQDEEDVLLKYFWRIVISAISVGLVVGLLLVRYHNPINRQLIEIREALKAIEVE